MKIKSIQYKNYRCFNDIKIDFETIPGKNIFMVVAPNGGGKTEMLFSFQWVLYGFDFKKLNAKEDAPYALNSSLYHSLQESHVGDSKKCSVELVFESDGKTYIVKRTEKFSKAFKGSGISSEQKISLSDINSKGVCSTPIEDFDLVDRKLSAIIPKNILQGIIFDGERMKQLSQVNDESKAAVEGVIKQITNVGLYQRCKSEFDTLLKENSKAIRSISKKTTGFEDVSDLEKEIEECLRSVELKEEQLRIDKIRVRELEERLEEIHNALTDSKETKTLEELRTQYKKDLDNTENEIEDLYDTLQDDLDNGYLLVCDDVLNSVSKLLDEYDIPAGLTVTAVRNILSRPTCICGHHFTEESKKLLEELISQLPPDNINSALGEMVNHARIDKNDLKDKLAKTFKKIRKQQAHVIELKELISEISQRITDGAPELIKALEVENKEKMKELGVKEKEIESLEDELRLLKKRIIQLRKDRDEGSKTSVMLKVLTKREAFITKCKNAMTAIENYNKMVSLQEINRKINESYEMLSEDYDNGRRLYIVQYNKRMKYRMASFLEKKFDRIYNYDAGAIAALRMEPDILDAEDALKEISILRVLEPNSTGQAKINTLAFAKSILEYSRANRDEDSNEISHSYPFLIDSPFTELSDDNLRKSAIRLHEFAEQVILMISNESLDSVKEYITPYVGGTVKLMKNVNDSSSTLIK